MTDFDVMRAAYDVSQILIAMKDYPDERERRNALQLADDVLAAFDRRKDRA